VAKQNRKLEIETENVLTWRKRPLQERHCFHHCLPNDPRRSHRSHRAPPQLIGLAWNCLLTLPSNELGQHHLDVESSDDAILSKTLDGTITSWNGGAEKMYGYSAGEMVGQHVSTLAPVDLKEEVAEILEQIRRGESVDLLHAIRGAWLRPSYLAPFVTRSKTIVGSFMRGQSGQKHPLRLTLRQREVLQLLADGRSMKEVAFALQIKPRTVAYHKYRMMDDFNLSSNAALLRFALRENVA
jgi:DNA-binding CsgD family transcriptional regulator